MRYRDLPVVVSFAVTRSFLGVCFEVDPGVDDTSRLEVFKRPVPNAGLHGVPNGGLRAWLLG